MTPFGKWVRNFLEKRLSRYYEGPTPPSRLQLMAFDFATRNANATRKQWFEFAVGLAEEAYRTGYVRGFEYTEREWDIEESPEAFADKITPGWRTASPIRILPGGGIQLPDERSEEEEIARHLREAKEYADERLESRDDVVWADDEDLARYERKL